MHRTPRTCTSGAKAIDAMQARHASAHAVVPSKAAAAARVPSESATAADAEAIGWVACAQDMELPPRKVAFFPVVDEGLLTGIVTLHGLVSAGL